MTEQEWLQWPDPVGMVSCLCHNRKVSRTKSGRRKLRLFACACCRRAVRLFPDESWWPLVDLAEGLAEGTVSQHEVDAAVEGVELVLRDGEGDPVRQARGSLLQAVRKLREPASHAALACSYVEIAIRWLGQGEEAERAQHVGLLRDIFGNPFRPPPVIHPAWLAWNGGAVVGLARTIYDERRFEDVLVLADALEEAGCRDEDVLGHLRGRGQHARGCFVIDLLKGRD